MTGNKIELSDRLSLVASFVRPGETAADIGTDHGYIPIHLVQSGVSPRALAMDVVPGPLERAEQHIRRYGLSDRIETRLSNGFEKMVPGETDTCVIAGMGGPLEEKIIEAGWACVRRLKHLILSPQSDIMEFRRFLNRKGLVIVREKMVKDAGKYYTVMDTELREEGSALPEDSIFLRFGACLIREKDPVFREYLEKERQVSLQILSELEHQDSGRSRERARELREYLAAIKEAEHEMQ
ncbi:MAG: class I SAM-dependent methyltransferase [Bacillota bacterium]|nr:class I SAM-dependent methyltransferase [Bacillota bacterium]